MTRSAIFSLLAAFATNIPCASVHAQDTMGRADSVYASASTCATASSGNFAPFYIASNNHGKITQAKTMFVSAETLGRHKLSSSFNLAWGFEVIADIASKTTYQRYEAVSGKFSKNPQRPSYIWAQQLWARGDYRSLFMQAGMRNYHSEFVNRRLSSGDLTRGCNTRPIPGISVGFSGFQPIPFTNRWIEINGKIEYGKYTDDGWWKSHYSYFTDHICLGSWFTYKNAYFRTKSSQPLSLTVGMQVASSFGGTSYYYEKGVLTETIKHEGGLKGAIKMFIPMAGDEDYYMGSTLGSWDIALRYRLRDGSSLRAYLSKPWETGSGIGFLNGFDGLWGIEWKAAETDNTHIRGIVAEYLDFTNQSGPIHFDPTDHPGCTLPVHCDGGDDYYNNYAYNPWAYYGMSIGTPLLPSPLYNLNGYPGFINTCVRGFHIGIEGFINRSLSYRFLGGYRKGWGTTNKPKVHRSEDTSLMLEAKWAKPLRNGRLDVNIQLAIDRGNIYGDQSGLQLGLNYKFNVL